jgi:serine-type D-Ala-D-Ala carboxypeptidase/endopeptidase (penicillin-binding protein 4)
MIFLRSFSALALILFLLAASDARVSGKGAALSAAARGDIQQQLTRAEGRRGTAACVVVDLDTGRTLFSAKADTPLSPASNMKLVTSAVALKVLGGDFEFRTQLIARDAVVDGALQGPLYVLAGGDPNLSGRFHDNDPLAIFRAFAARLKEAGINRIDGGLQFDSSMFGGPSYGAGWPGDDQYVRWYCAEVSAFAFNDNCVGIRVLPGDVGKPARIEVIPPTAYVNIINETTTAPGRKGAEIGVLRPRGTNNITVRGRVYEQATWGYFTDVTVHEPALYAATVLRETLQAEGINVRGETGPTVLRATELQDSRVLAEHRSTLLEALGPINTNSQNLHAEMLFRQLGLRHTGKGTFRTSQAALEHYLTQKGWWHEGLVVDDGSGLSRNNRVSAAMLTRLLQSMAEGEHFEAFRDSLAVAGESGTLARRLNDRAVRGNVYAKTGYIRGVRALSGYLLTDNRRIAFSILMNNCVHDLEVRDEIVRILARAVQ